MLKVTKPFSGIAAKEDQQGQKIVHQGNTKFMIFFHTIFSTKTYFSLR
jgi:hypothetical protein